MSTRSHRSPTSEPEVDAARLPEVDEERGSDGPSNQSMQDQLVEQENGEDRSSYIELWESWFGAEQAPSIRDIDGPELREKHEGTAWERPEDGQVFVQGEGDETAVHGNDVAQGQLGDCYFMASMMAVANVSPESIEKLIHDNGDGTYDVTLHLRNDAGQVEPTVVTVDGRLAGGDSPIYADLGDEGREMWPAILEKAMAQYVGSYEGMTGGNIGDSIDYGGALEILTGRDEEYHSTAGMTEDEVLQELHDALASGTPIRVGSREMSDDAEMTAEANAQNVYGNHAYVPSAVDLENRTVSLLNPWGQSHVENLSIEDFMKYYSSYRKTDGPIGEQTPSGGQE